MRSPLVAPSVLAALVSIAVPTKAETQAQPGPPPANTSDSNTSDSNTTDSNTSDSNTTDSNTSDSNTTDSNATDSNTTASDTKSAPSEEDDQDDLEIEVVAPPTRQESVSTAIEGEQARRLPGTQGDVLRVVESMPGVARATAGSGQLVVWGAAPEETRVYVDGVPLPRLYHDGGVRSVLHSDFVKSVELSPGGYGAAYGRALGGLVTVATKKLEGSGYHGSLSADLLDAGGTVRGAVANNVYATVGGRVGYLHALLPALTREDVGDYFALPRYGDAHARVRYVVSQRESVELAGLLSTDALDRTAPDPDPTRARTETRGLNFGRVWVRYTKELEEGATVTVVPFAGVDQSRLVSRFGGTPTELRSDAVVYGVRASWLGRLSRDVSMTFGLDAEGSSASLFRAGSLTNPAREGDVRVFGQPPTDQVNADTWQTTRVGLAPFAEADIALFAGRLHVVPGVRVEPYFKSASRRTPVVASTPRIGLFESETGVEPRVATRFAVTPEFEIRAALGAYRALPRAEDLSAVFGTPTLPSSHALHALVGTSVRVSDTLAVESTFFFSPSWDLAVRSALSTPLLAEALTPVGTGRAFGVQFLLRKQLAKKLFGWLGYTVSRSERKDVPGGPERLFDYDQSHVVSALAAYEIGWGVELGARFRFASGFPRTPVRNTYYDARRDGYEPVFGAHNSDRIPFFFQFDVRVSKRLAMGNTELEAYLDVQNVTNRPNPEEFVYGRDYRERGTITGLPLLPVLGLRWSW